MQFWVKEISDILVSIADSKLFKLSPNSRKHLSTISAVNKLQGFFHYEIFGNLIYSAYTYAKLLHVILA